MSQLENITVSLKRKHLTEAERKTIERMLRAGANKGEIAKALFRHKSTIKREIKRGSVSQLKRNPYAGKNPKYPKFIERMVYFYDVGQRIYLKHRDNCGNKNKVVACTQMVSYIENKILGPERWSVDAAIGYAKVNNLFPGQQMCTKTFYNWIEDRLVKVRNIDLLLKVRRRPKRLRRERKRHLGKSIEERPGIVETRKEFGHWEGDGIVGKRHKGQLISLVERKLGIGLLFNAKDRNSDRMVHIINNLEQQYGKQFPIIFKSITFDNGLEFADSISMEGNGRINIYYAHPYSSFERGTNENWNGIVRRFIPKGLSFDNLRDDDLHRITSYINTLPRKRFGYRTPLDLWNEQQAAILSN